jgi:hypothetical protein
MAARQVFVEKPNLIDNLSGHEEIQRRDTGTHTGRGSDQRIGKQRQVIAQAAIILSSQRNAAGNDRPSTCLARE